MSGLTQEDFNRIFKIEDIDPNYYVGFDDLVKQMKSKLDSKLKESNKSKKDDKEQKEIKPHHGSLVQALISSDVDIIFVKNFCHTKIESMLNCKVLQTWSITEK